jgi:hypothetical protein
MNRHFLVTGILAFSALARARDTGAQTLPPTLPLNGTVIANTCVVNPNEPCNAISYPSPIATSRFTLDQPSTVNFMMWGEAGYAPVIYLSGDGCDDTACGPELPAGSYCVTVTADAESTIGSCGGFVLAVQTIGTEVIFSGGFEG